MVQRWVLLLVAEAIQNAQVEEVKDANGLDAVKVTFASGILFATGKNDLSGEAKASLQQLAGVLKGNSDIAPAAGWRAQGQ